MFGELLKIAVQATAENELTHTWAVSTDMNIHRTYVLTLPITVAEPSSNYLLGGA